MGWLVDNGPDRLGTFHPAEHFRKALYRPDVIQLVLAKGDSAEAVRVANAALKKAGVAVREAVTSVDKLLPPVVKLSVVDTSRLPAVTLKVEARSGAKEQPLQSLQILVDGRPFSGANARVVFGREEREDTRQWQVSLPPGRHQLAVLARSADAVALSNKVEVDTRTPADKPVLHVLAVGIDKYKDKTLNLTCAANDAKSLAKAFQDKCKGELFGDVRAQTLLNEKATRDGVLAELNKLRTDPQKPVKPNDTVVVFFACHGAKEKDRFYLLPHGAKVGDLAKTALPGKDLNAILSDFPCQVLLIMDSCHAAGFGPGGILGQKGLRPATDDAARAMTEGDVGIAVMCAAMGYEKAAERAGNGLLTKALVEALTETDVPFSRKNRQQYIHHLQAHVFDSVAAESKEKQHPFLYLPWFMESFPVRHLPEPPAGKR
jgi:hypothetical protein